MTSLDRILIFYASVASICLSEIACILTGYLIEKNVEIERKLVLKKNLDLDRGSSGRTRRFTSVEPRTSRPRWRNRKFSKTILCYLSGNDLSEDFVYLLVLNSLCV